MRSMQGPSALQRCPLCNCVKRGAAGAKIQGKRIRALVTLLVPPLSEFRGAGMPGFPRQPAKSNVGIPFCGWLRSRVLSSHQIQVQLHSAALFLPD